MQPIVFCTFASILFLLTRKNCAIQDLYENKRRAGYQYGSRWAQGLNVTDLSTLV